MKAGALAGQNLPDVPGVPTLAPSPMLVTLRGVWASLVSDPGYPSLAGAEGELRPPPPALCCPHPLTCDLSGPS